MNGEKLKVLLVLQKKNLGYDKKLFLRRFGYTKKSWHNIDHLLFQESIVDSTNGEFLWIDSKLSKNKVKKLIKDSNADFIDIIYNKHAMKKNFPRYMNSLLYSAAARSRKKQRGKCLKELLTRWKEITGKQE